MADDSQTWTIDLEKKHIDKLGEWSSYKFNRIDLLIKYKKSLRQRSRFDWLITKKGNTHRSKMKPKDIIAVIEELETYVDKVLFRERSKTPILFE